MAAGKYNFIVEQGSQHEVTFRYKLSSGSYQDLTNYRVRMSVKDHITDTAYVYQATSDDTEDTGYDVDFTIASPQTGSDLGKFTLTIPSATTTDFTFNQGVYDLEIVDSSDVVTRLLEGKFKIKLQVSE
jgi:hypothetical protein